jgi:thiol-disulfide isomerase/thioredoxin
LINFESVLRTATAILSEPDKPHVSSHWFVEALGDVVVGRHSEQKKGYQSLWNAGHDILRCILDIILHMTTKRILGIIVGVIGVAAGLYLMEPWKKEESRSRATSIPPMVSTGNNELPSLTVTFGDQSSKALRELSGDVLLIFFNPDCDHCQQEAEQMAANKEAFANWQVYFIASIDAKAAEDFGVKYKLTDANYHFGFAGVSEVYNAVGPLSQVPTIIVYKNRMFVRKFEGVTPIDDIKKVL